MPSLPACSLGKEGFQPSVRGQDALVPRVFLGKEGFQPSTRAGCPRSQGVPWEGGLPALRPRAGCPRSQGVPLGRRASSPPSEGRMPSFPGCSLGRRASSPPSEGRMPSFPGGSWVLLVVLPAPGDVVQADDPVRFSVEAVEDGQFRGRNKVACLRRRVALSGLRL